MSKPNLVRDSDGVVHVEHRYPAPSRTLGRDNDVIEGEEEIVVTDCGDEVDVRWSVVAGPPTCIACLGNPWVLARRAAFGKDPC